MTYTIPFLQGGGIGYDQEQSVRRILEASGVAIDWEVIPTGRAALEQGQDPLPHDALEAARQQGLAFKTKLLPPVVGDPINYNVLVRRELGVFASVRPVQNLPHLPSRFSGVNFTLVREITEDLYNSNEHIIVPGVVQSIKIVTESACLRFFRFAFELARRQGRNSIHCIHKANILKQADGLFLDCFRRVARDFPEIEPKEMIVDNGCMQMVTRPTQFEMVVAGNLYGDLLSDLGAGLVGGISGTAAINHGPGIRVYEAIFGASYEQVPPNQANPLPALMPAVEMLRDLGEAAAAYQIGSAIAQTLDDDIRTKDLGGEASTQSMTDAIIARLGTA